MSSDSSSPTVEGSGFVVVALGANVGPSVRNIQDALARLEQSLGVRVRASSCWETEPVDCPPGSPPFVNAAAVFRAPAGHTPESLLRLLQQIEKEFGRRPKQVLNEPRPLDLDLITFGEVVCSTPNLTLPHPRAKMRRFVLAPLAELAPRLVLPGGSETVSELLARLPVAPGARKLP